jgi:hypothetical protein
VAPENDDLETEVRTVPVDPVQGEPASRGGKTIVEKYGKEYMAELGRRGSRAVVRKYGLRFYSEIAARNKGVKKRPRSEPA